MPKQEELAYTQAVQLPWLMWHHALEPESRRSSSEPIDWRGVRSDFVFEMKNQRMSSRSRSAESLHAEGDEVGMDSSARRIFCSFVQGLRIWKSQMISCCFFPCLCCHFFGYHPTTSFFISFFLLPIAFISSAILLHHVFFFFFFVFTAACVLSTSGNLKSCFSFSFPASFSPLSFELLFLLLHPSIQRCNENCCTPPAAPVFFFPLQQTMSWPMYARFLSSFFPMCFLFPNPSVFCLCARAVVCSLVQSLLQLWVWGSLRGQGSWFQVSARRWHQSSQIGTYLRLLEIIEAQWNSLCSASNESINTGSMSLANHTFVRSRAEGRMLSSLSSVEIEQSLPIAETIACQAMHTVWPGHMDYTALIPMMRTASMKSTPLSLGSDLCVDLAWHRYGILQYRDGARQADGKLLFQGSELWEVGLTKFELWF